MPSNREMFEVFADFMEFTHEEPLGTQKALLSAAYLLDWMSEIGNDSVPGAVATGISQALRKCADDAGRLLFSAADVAQAGGDVRSPKEPAE